MASPHIYSNGLAGTGPTLATVLGDYFSGDVWWLDTVNGTDAVSPAGKDRETPLKTLSQAYTNAAAGDLIVIEAGSSETLGASQAFAKAGLTVLGLGTGANRPRYTCSGTVDMFSVTASNVRFFNLYFPASTGVATSRLKTISTSTVVNGCYFECGNKDTNAAFTSSNAAQYLRIINTSFVVTASRPAGGISAAGADDIYFENVVFDGGSYGWTDYACKFTGASNRLFVNGLTLMNRSDYGMTLTGTSYQLYGVNTSGTGRVDITA